MYNTRQDWVFALGIVLALLLGTLACLSADVPSRLASRLLGEDRGVPRLAEAAERRSGRR
jgi:hypothetical protein